MKTEYQFSQETLKISLGKMLNNEDAEVYFKARKFFVLGVFSKSRTGKTSIIKNILIKANCGVDEQSWDNNRRIIVFDPYGEYYKLGRENTRKKFGWAISNLKVIKNFTIPLHFFNIPTDWHSFGIADLGAKICADVAKRIDVHNDNPDNFVDILSKLPVDDYHLKKFNEEFAHFNFELPRRLPETTVTSLVAKANYLRNIFSRSDDGKEAITNFASLVLNNNVVFDFDVENEESKLKAQAYVGVILRQIKDVLSIIHPIIAIEEADFFCANAPFGQKAFNAPSCLFELEELVIKLQRLGLGLIFVTQDEKLLSQTIVHNLHSFIVGKVDPDSRYWKYSEGLFWNFDAGIRQFVYFDEKFKAYPFIPDIPDCEV